MTLVRIWGQSVSKVVSELRCVEKSEAEVALVENRAPGLQSGQGVKRKDGKEIYVKSMDLRQEMQFFSEVFC